MGTQKTKSQHGQSLVLVALMALGLFGMLALVLDGGNLYTQRREAQLAADAGALAGARTYCETENALAAQLSAEDYAVTRNAADSINFSLDAGREVD